MSRPSKPGRVTSRDVAAVAGVSQSTVSRVLSGDAKVSPENRAAVLSALERVGYQRNGIARAMRTNRVDAVGVVVTHVVHAFYPAILESIGSELADNDLRMMLWEGDRGMASAVDAIQSGMVDGAIFTNATTDLVPLQVALSSNLPVVLVVRSVTGAFCDQIVSDDRKGGRMVAELFASTGHQRVAMISGPTGISTVDERLAGFKAGLGSGRSAPKLVAHLPGPFTHDHGVAAMLELAKLPEPPTAVFCANDILAFGALDGARSIGWSIPDSVSIVGFGDIPMAAWPSFDLSTIRQPTGAMASLAAQRLIARVRGDQEQPNRWKFPIELVLRGSTNAPRTADGTSTLSREPSARPIPPPYPGQADWFKNASRTAAEEQ